MSSTIPGHGHPTVPSKIGIPQADARQPLSSDTTPGTPTHGHGTRVVIGHTHATAATPAAAPRDVAVHVAIPDTESVRAPDAEDTTPGHGHMLFAFPPAHDAPSTPTHPRPSARVSRRSSLFSTADDVRDEAPVQDNARREHPLLDVAHGGVMPPTMEAEEPSSAEIDGHFYQPEAGHGAEAGAVEGSA
ncbi:hypothetical protein C8Q78DRAFT_992556 [Trametes maxima]|nr:hypothetical protein C8Q78DRAFT_992556 [Trametes maxima]